MRHQKPHQAKPVSDAIFPGKSETKGRGRFLPLDYRGILIDLFFFLFNIYLVRFSTRHMGHLLSRTYLADDPQAARILLILFGAASFAQILGAALKRRPLQARLLAKGDGFHGIFGLFLILHFALMLITTVGIQSLLPYPSSGGMTLLAIVLSTIPTTLVWRALTPYKTPPKPDWRNSRAMEAFANLCLFAYMMVNLAVWNTVTAGSNVRASGVGDALERGLGFVLMSPVLLLFYIPPRLLFLVEDYKYPATWISMTMAVAPVAYRLIIGAPLSTDW